MTERISADPRELNFYGEGKAEDIRRGFAITSLRNPNTKYSFTRGETILANCVDDNEKVEVVVISNETKKLKDHHIPVLALDGFFSAAHAADGLRSGGYPGYEKTKPGSSMQAIIFVKKTSFDALPENLKDKLLNVSPESFLKSQELRHLFFPTMCAHLSNYGGMTDWINFLCVNRLISLEEKYKMQNYEVAGRNLAELLQNHTGVFQKLPFASAATYYRPMVLGLFD